jgi:hypothetical protein
MLSTPPDDTANATLPERYARNILAIDRAAENAQGAKGLGKNEFGLELEIKKLNGASVAWESLSDIERTKAREAWVMDYATQLGEKLAQVPGLQAIVEAENKAIEDALSAAGAKTVTADSLMETYRNALNTAFLGVADKVEESTQGASRDIKQNRLNALAANMEPGDFLTSVTTSSGMGTGLGHASIIATPNNSSWDNSWRENTNISFTVSSWGNQRNVWNNGQGGVQTEPLSVWLNEWASSDGAMDRMNICKVHSHDLLQEEYYDSDGNLQTNYYYGPAKAVGWGQRLGAVNYARAQIGKPFNWLLVWKWKTDEFYCSQLVWRAWYENSINLSANWFTASPSEIMNSNYSQIAYSD